MEFIRHELETRTILTRNSPVGTSVYLVPFNRISKVPDVTFFLSQGSADEKVHCSPGQATASTTRKADCKAELKVYENLGYWHKIPDEIDDFGNFPRASVD
ncbi:hypothetical protein PpBr36_05054 [Pyricularia pennisetigena]|uniref:hypothetical protein n=1 Tax=Pyricularia pennisetigena TaxID=1578925 RepID=UPI00114E4556|nr:hypothetical protein PpBr36_05054 [Pyricularia pennisetigena]TLS27000.1 hypothetical protein PpBr36_05054 [Pyricularia pennisetigena]